jgi:hypothetical protein
MPRLILRAGRTLCNTHSRLRGARSICQTACPQKAADTPDKAYAKSLLLPRTAFPLKADAVRREPLFRQRTCDDLYQWQVGLPALLVQKNISGSKPISEHSRLNQSVPSSSSMMARRMPTEVYTSVCSVKFTDDQGLLDDIDLLLRVGHALNKILKDIINRYKLLRGFRIQYMWSSLLPSIFSNREHQLSTWMGLSRSAHRNEGFSIA